MPTTACAALKRAGGDLAKMALDAGLVTALKGRTDVEERLVQITGPNGDDETYIGVDHWSYLANLRSQEALAIEPSDKVGVIVATGEIVPGEQPPGVIGSDSLARQLRDARDDEDIRAVVLRIDSPGGSVFASEVIRREIAALREAGKPVVASMSSLAASGGYYIAMDADRIVASPATLTGSIGIFAIFPTFERSLEKLGVHVDGVGTTVLSGDFRLDRSLGEVSREIVQQSLEYEYRQFVSRVAQARKKNVDSIDAVARGRVWAGKDALHHGLVDRLGGYDDAIELAAELAELGDDYDVEVLETEIGISEALGLRLRAARGAGGGATAPGGFVAEAPRCARAAGQVLAAAGAPQGSAPSLQLLHRLPGRVDRGRAWAPACRSASYPDGHGAAGLRSSSSSTRSAGRQSRTPFGVHTIGRLTSSGRSVIAASSVSSPTPGSSRPSSAAGERAVLSASCGVSPAAAKSPSSCGRVQPVFRYSTMVGR